MLEETGTKLSISKVKRVLHRHNLKGRTARKKPLLQNSHKKDRLRFATAHGDKGRTFWRNVLWSDDTKMELLGHNDHRYVRKKKGETCKPKNTIPTVKQRVAASCCGGAFLQEGVCTSQNRWHHEEGYIILKQHLKTSVRKLKQMCLPNGQ
jgi:hypothetical protein